MARRQPPGSKGLRLSKKKRATNSEVIALEDAERFVRAALDRLERGAPHREGLIQPLHLSLSALVLHRQHLCKQIDEPYVELG